MEQHQTNVYIIGSQMQKREAAKTLLEEIMGEKNYVRTWGK